MKVLVTGGSGFLGTFVRRFFDADDFSRRSNFDLLNLQDAAIVQDYDVVIHLAAMLDKSPEATEEVFLTNVEGTVNLLRSMRKGSVFIFASTKDVYGRFADNYKVVPETCPTIYAGQTVLEWSKLIAEHYVAFYAYQREFRYCIFRLSAVYAPLSEGNTPNFVTHYAESIKRGIPICLPANCDPVRDILYVDDFSEACKAFIDSVLPNGLYNLGGGIQNAVSLRELIRRMEEISGFQAVIDEVNKLPSPVPLNYISDLTRINQELGWSPQISVEKGIKRLFE